MADDTDWNPPDSELEPAWTPPETELEPAPVVSTNKNTHTDEETGLEVEDARLGPDAPYDVMHQAASGTGHAIYGGLKGVGKLIQTGDMDKAADTVNRETAKSYRAPDSTLNAISESKYNPLNWAQGAADSIADNASDNRHLVDQETGIDTGPSKPVAPWEATAMKAAPTAIGAITGLRSMRSGKPPVAADIAPVTAKDVVGQAVTDQSMGAAAAPPVDVTKLTPETQQSIVDAHRAGQGVNMDAVMRHHDAETLPMPEGEGPLRLRKGQATQDPQRFRMKSTCGPIQTPIRCLRIRSRIRIGNLARALPRFDAKPRRMLCSGRTLNTGRRP
jgi:hypothetical protein